MRLVSVAACFSLGACSLIYSDYADRFEGDASVDAGGDGSADASHDATAPDVFIAPCGPAGIPTASGAQCPTPGMTCFMQTCCMMPDAGDEYMGCLPLGQCETGAHGTSWPCDKPFDCAQGDTIQCCLDQQAYALNRMMCPNTLIPEGGLSAPTCRSAGCSPGEATLCTQKSDCPTGTSCIATVLMTNPPKTIGLCE